ncbi:hypothetical protein Tco_1387959 [Tanacetum coccineum]
MFRMRNGGKKFPPILFHRVRFHGSCAEGRLAIRFSAEIHPRRAFRGNPLVLNSVLGAMPGAHQEVNVNTRNENPTKHTVRELHIDDTDVFSNVTGNDTEATGSPTAVTDTLSVSATVSGNVTGIVNTTSSGSTDIGNESIVTTTKVTGLINNPTGSTSGQSSLSIHTSGPDVLSSANVTSCEEVTSHEAMKSLLEKFSTDMDTLSVNTTKVNANMGHNANKCPKVPRLPLWMMILFQILILL